MPQERGKLNSDPPVLLARANDVVGAPDCIPVPLGILVEGTDCITLSDTDCLLTIGRRCVGHGYRFVHESYEATLPLVKLDGPTVTVRCGIFTF